jgi:serine/threonine-protein kinase RsbW
MERSLTIPSDPAAIDQVEAFLVSLAEDLGLSEDATGDLIIAGTEAANNAILHGNRGRPELQVRLEVLVTPDGSRRRLELAVHDMGHGLPEAPPEDPTSPEHLLDISGRGLLIIRHLMDDVRILPGPRGTTVVLVKSLA